MLGFVWAAGIALGAATAPLPTVPPDRFLDSLRSCEGIMAYRTVYDSTAFALGPDLPERRVRSSAVEGDLQQRWLALLTAPGLVPGSDCEPVCLRCEHRANYELMFPPHPDSISVGIRWHDHRVLYLVGGHVIAHRTLTGADTAWASLLQATFPTDSVTAGLQASDPVPRGKHASLRVEDYIYLEHLPEVQVRPLPEYPPHLRKQGIGGVVQVMALVGANGRVLEAYVKPPGLGFEQAAIAAVRQWQFTAARCGGKRVASWVLLPIRFQPN